MIVKPDYVNMIEIHCSSDLAAFRLADLLKTRIGKQHVGNSRNVVKINPTAMRSPEATLVVVAETINRLGMQ